jgi:CubicO group peptidase (beta-lactamase class C family)
VQRWRRSLLRRRISCEWAIGSECSAISVAAFRSVTSVRLRIPDRAAIVSDAARRAAQFLRPKSIRFVTRAGEAAHVAGVGLAVFNHGQVAYLKAYGLRDVQKHLPLTPDSVMTAASLTKPAFVTMMMQFVHAHLIELDKPVYEYLPKPLHEYRAYKDLADDPRYKHITMRMLLDHTSGFPIWRWFTDDKKLKIYFTPELRFPYSGEGIWPKWSWRSSRRNLLVS